MALELLDASQRRRRRHSAPRLNTLNTELLRFTELKTVEECIRSLERRIPFFQPKLTEEELVCSKEGLCDAFLALSASKEVGEHGSGREVSESASRMARRFEDKVIKLISEVGDVVTCSEVPKESTRAELRDDETFAFFCEKAMLTTLAGVFTSDPTTQGPYSGVAWSPRVKAQVLQTVGDLVGEAKESALYYLLSQHCVSYLLVHLLPLDKWTTPALEVLTPPYAALLRKLTMQLGSCPELFPFFIVQGEDQQTTAFPLLSAMTHLTMSPGVQSDSYVHATCLNLIVGLMKISDSTVRSWISRAKSCFHHTTQSQRLSHRHRRCLQRRHRYCDRRPTAVHCR